MTLLQGKTALVTGASSGIGRAIALQLARRKVKLCLVGRSKQRLYEVRKNAEEDSDTVIDVPADLNELYSVERLAKLVKREFGELHMLVHSAGAISIAGIERASVEDFERQLAINVMAPFLLTKELLPLLKKSEGQVMFINSSVVYHPRADTIQFAATQHALKGIADNLRAEMNELGIRVSSVFPGRTATPRQQRLHEIEGKPYRPERLLQPDDIADIVVNTLSLPSSVEVTDIHLRPTLKS
jgi:NADP-dependent 3-hydroxy acid dehydrogenase YdfG